MCFFFSLVLWLGICVSGWKNNYYLTPPPTPPTPIFSLPTTLSLTQVTATLHLEKEEAKKGPKCPQMSVAKIAKVTRILRL